MRRISRGTPYILTTGEIESRLATLKDDPQMEQATAETFGLTVEQWRKLTVAKRAKHLIDLQERGLLAAATAYLEARAASTFASPAPAAPTPVAAPAPAAAAPGSPELAAALAKFRS